MLKSKHSILIASTSAHSGKTTTILGLAKQFQAQNLSLGYSKPIGTQSSRGVSPADRAIAADKDFEVIQTTLGLDQGALREPLLFLDRKTFDHDLSEPSALNYQEDLISHLQDFDQDVVFLEGPGNLWDGSLFHLSIKEMAPRLDAKILLVVPYRELLVVDSILAAQQFLGESLLGVVINKIPPEEMALATETIKPFLESHRIPVFALMPHDRLLRSVSVREIASQLNAEVLCRGDRLDLMVENLTIGAMNVNAALEYFRKGRNMVVVTGGDRTDLQLAALETSTQCLILTGHVKPQPVIISRAEDLEIPILSVDCDTLTTVEIVDRAFGNIRIQETIKVQCAEQMIGEHFDVARLLTLLG